MVQKVRKKGYFANRRKLTIIISLIIVALCILITAFIIKLVYSQEKKESKSEKTSEQTSEIDNENKKYKTFANNFESDPENKALDISDTSMKIGKSLDVVLIKKLIINSSVLELKSPIDENRLSQIELDFLGGKFSTLNMETLWYFWKGMEILKIGEVDTLTEPEQANPKVIDGEQLILELCDYNIRSMILRGFYDTYKAEYKDKAQNVVLFSHIIAFMNSFEIRLYTLILKNRIEIDDLKEWQSEKKNKLVLMFMNKFQHIILGLPLFMIFNFITELNTLEMTKNDEQDCEQYKPLLERILNTDTFTKEQIDVIKGKFYKLFSLLETQEIQGDATEDEPGKIDAVYQLLQLLDDDLKNFLVIYKKIK